MHYVEIDHTADGEGISACVPFFLEALSVEYLNACTRQMSEGFFGIFCNSVQRNKGRFGRVSLGKANREKEVSRRSEKVC